MHLATAGRPAHEPPRPPTVDGSVSPNYSALRGAHFRLTLRGWFRGLDKTLLALAAALTFLLTAMVTLLVVTLANGLELLIDTTTPPGRRALVVAAWLTSSFVLLRALREAVFMPRARLFIDSLPVKAAQKLRQDLWLSSLAYSILWLPVAWVLAVSPGRGGAGALSLMELIALSLAFNITVIRSQWREALVALTAAALYTAIGGEGALPSIARLACALLGASALWRSYLPGARRVPAPRAPSALADALAIRSGLVLPLLANELRSNFLVRTGFIAATLAACLIVIRLRTNDASTASVVLFVAAAATLALYRLPALIRQTLLIRLPFIAGQAAFARRMRLSVYLVPTLVFAASVVAAWPFDRSGTAWRDAGTFALLYAGGVTGARAGFAPIHWIVPFLGAVALIILGAMT